jgi:hypothetical protein
MLSSIVAVTGAVALHFTTPSQCLLHEANRLVHRWEGSCGRLFGQEAKMRLKPATTIVSGRWRKDVAPITVWAGDMTDEGHPNAPIELELYDGGSGVLRTEYAWYAVTAYSATATALTFQLDTARVITPNALDREIVRRADALLSSVSVWNRADNRRCPGDATAWSIYCAMERGMRETTCGAHHRRPAMEVVREIIEARTARRNYEHRLMDYNNDSTTTLADVHQIFAEALSRIGGPVDEPLAKAAVCPPTPQPAITAVDIKILERAQEILGSPDAWNRHDLQECPASAKTFGIFCAFKKASEEVIGEFDEVSPVMREARQVIDFVAAKQYGARLVDYNNDPATTFADIQAFFRILRHRMSRRLAG